MSTRDGISFIFKLFIYLLKYEERGRNGWFKHSYWEPTLLPNSALFGGKLLKPGCPLSTDTGKQLLLLSGSFCLCLASYEMFPSTEQGLPKHHILVPEVLPALSTCVSERGQTFSVIAPWLPCHALPHTGPSMQALWPLSQGVSLWRIVLSCFFLGGLDNQAQLEGLKQTREILWSLFKYSGITYQELPVSLWR